MAWSRQRCEYRGLTREAYTLDLRPPAEHALISLLALNRLRVPEATGADIEHLGLERGHRTLVITRKTPQGLSCQVVGCLCLWDVW